MTNLLKVVFIIFLSVFSIGAYAQNKVVVIPMGSSDGVDWFVKGHTADIGPGYSWGGSFDTIAEVAFDLEVARRVLIQGEFEVWTYQTTCQTAGRIAIDDVTNTNSLTSQEIKYVGSGNPRELIVTSAMVDLEAGAHTAKLQMYDGCGWNKGTRLHVLELQPTTE